MTWLMSTVPCRTANKLPPGPNCKRSWELFVISDGPVGGGLPKDFIWTSYTIERLTYPAITVR